MVSPLRIDAIGAAELAPGASEALVAIARQMISGALGCVGNGGDGMTVMSGHCASHAEGERGCFIIGMQINQWWKHCWRPLTQAVSAMLRELVALASTTLPVGLGPASWRTSFPNVVPILAANHTTIIEGQAKLGSTIGPMAQVVDVSGLCPVLPEAHPKNLSAACPRRITGFD